MKPNGQQAASKMDHLQQTTHVYVIACAGAVFDLISGTQGDCNQHLVRYATGWVTKSIADATIRNCSICTILANVRPSMHLPSTSS